MNVRLTLGLTALAALFVVAVAALWPEYPPEPPDSYATFRDPERSFRHPPGWRAARRPDGTVEVRGFVVLAVRTRIAEDSRDARMIAGSLRLER